MKYTILIIITMFLISSTSKAESSYYLGKSQSFIKKEKGEPWKTEIKNGQTVYIYKKITKKGAENLTLYYFSNSLCTTIVQNFEMWFIIPWTDILSEQYNRIDKHNWIEKGKFLHQVSVIDDDMFMYIIKYKD